MLHAADTGAVVSQASFTSGFFVLWTLLILTGVIIVEPE